LAVFGHGEQALLLCVELDIDRAGNKRAAGKVTVRMPVGGRDLELDIEDP
jgi:hypothetical protein